MPTRPAGITLWATLEAELEGDTAMSKILVAYDGSESAQRALTEAAKLANGNGLTVVSVAEPLPQFGRAGELMLPEEDAERRRELRDAKQLLEERGVKADVRRAQGRRRDVDPRRGGGGTRRPDRDGHARARSRQALADGLGQHQGAAPRALQRARRPLNRRPLGPCPATTSEDVAVRTWCVIVAPARASRPAEFPRENYGRGLMHFGFRPIRIEAWIPPPRPSPPASPC